jgi:hypothetical protein
VSLALLKVALLGNSCLQEEKEMVDGVRWKSQDRAGGEGE